MTTATRRTTARTQLLLISTVQVLVMALWFAASAVLPALTEQWQLDRTQATLLATSLQLGFVAGALVSAALNLADRIPAHVLMGVCGLAGCALTGALTLDQGGFVAALVLRFLTGVSLAGVYPVGMKLMTTWYATGRGMAMGVLIAALTLGSSLPQLLVGVAGDDWRRVLLLATGLAAAGGLVALLLVRPGPFVTPSPPFAPRYAVRMLRDPVQLRINIGYYGHMWELYAFWTWLPAAVAAMGLFGGGSGSQGSRTGLLGFAVIGLAGAAGCLLAGRWSERLGAVRVARWALTTSGLCAVASFALWDAPAAVVVPLLLLWGAAVIADSGQFSAALADATDARYVGTALTLQTAVGFALTTVTIQGLPYLADATSWRLAFLTLCLGPLAGVIAISGRAFRAGTPPAPGAVWTTSSERSIRE